MSYIPFHKPSISEEEISAVVEALQSCWLTTGPKVREFEDGFAASTGAKHAIAVNSCTAGLHLALEAIGTKKDDVVLTTPMTFAATAEVVRYFDASPVFVDIDPETLNIDVSKLEEAIIRCRAQSLRVAAVLPVHYAGQPCRMEGILALADQYGLRVIEDAAHAFPAAYKGRNVGTIGDITSFSFYATKTITTGDGGMITTDNDEYASRMKIMSLHGISADAWNRYSAEGDWYYEIAAPGYKYNMTDVAASLGIVQLRKAEAFRTEREAIAFRYSEAFSLFPQLQIPYVSPDVRHSWHLYVLRLNTEQLSIGRNQFIKELKSRGIGTSVHFIPLHLHPYYRERYGYKPEDLPAAYGVYQRIVSLPIYPGMAGGDVDRVIEAVADVLGKNSK